MTMARTTDAATSWDVSNASPLGQVLPRMIASLLIQPTNTQAQEITHAEARTHVHHAHTCQIIEAAGGTMRLLVHMSARISGSSTKPTFLSACFGSC